MKTQREISREEFIKTKIEDTPLNWSIWKRAFDQGWYQKEVYQKQIIYLSGPQGNAFYLMGLAKNFSKQLGFNPNEVIAEMKQSNYTNLLNVFKKYFGEFIEIKEN